MMTRVVCLLLCLISCLSVPAWALSVSVRLSWELPAYYAVSDTDCSDSQRPIGPTERAQLNSIVEYSVSGGPVQTVATSDTFIQIDSVPVGSEVRARVKSFLPGGDGCWTDWAVLRVPVPRVGCGRIVEFRVVPQ